MGDISRNGQDIKEWIGRFPLSSFKNTLSKIKFEFVGLIYFQIVPHLSWTLNSCLPEFVHHSSWPLISFHVSSILTPEFEPRLSWPLSSSLVYLDPWFHVSSILTPDFMSRLTWPWILNLSPKSKKREEKSFLFFKVLSIYKYTCLSKNLIYFLTVFPRLTLMTTTADWSFVLSFCICSIHSRPAWRTTRSFSAILAFSFRESSERVFAAILALSL